MTNIKLNKVILTFKIAIYSMESRNNNQIDYWMLNKLQTNKKVLLKSNKTHKSIKKLLLINMLYVFKTLLNHYLQQIQNLQKIIFKL